MVRYEYSTKRVHTAELDSELAAYGSEGWYVADVRFIDADYSGGPWYALIMERAYVEGGVEQPGVHLEPEPPAELDIPLSTEPVHLRPRSPWGSFRQSGLG